MLHHHHGSKHDGCPCASQYAVVCKSIPKILLDHSRTDNPVGRLRLCLDNVPAAKMQKYTVSTLVNKPQNDNPQVIQTEWHGSLQLATHP